MGVKKIERAADTRPEVELYAELERHISAFGDIGEAREELIEILHEAQTIFGWLSRDVQLHIARRLGIPGAEVFGVVSFYSFFATEPPGRHTISVCMGTACFVRGADKILKGLETALGIGPEETTADRRFTLREVRCVGACGLAPVVLMDGKVCGKVPEDGADEMMQPYFEENNNGD